MTALAPTQRGAFLSGLTEADERQSAPVAAWQQRLRDGAAPVASLSLPSPQQEAWRFNDLKPLAELKAVVAPKASVAPAAIAPYALAESEGARLVFVNGRYAPELSSTAALGAGVTVVPFAEAPAELLEQHLGRQIEATDLFAALNARLVSDGALVAIAADVLVAPPIHVLFVGSAPEGAGAAFARLLIVLGAGARATVVEDYLGLGGTYVTNALTEVRVAASATLHHVRLQRESASALHYAHLAVGVGRDATYQGVSLSLGARRARLDLAAALCEPGAHAALDGLAVIAGDQEADTHSRIAHVAANGTSAQLHKCIIDDRAHAIFNGGVRVEKGAQLTDSVQSSRNLLLSDRARIDTKPQLEIFADEVKCAHGATVGQLDTEELFYLRSRGLSEAAARDLLVYAFAGEIIERVGVGSLRAVLRERVIARARHQAEADTP